MPATKSALDHPTSASATPQAGTVMWAGQKSMSMLEWWPVGMPNWDGVSQLWAILVLGAVKTQEGQQWSGGLWISGPTTCRKLYDFCPKVKRFV